MARYNAKYGKIAFGWEVAFRTPSTTYDEAVNSTAMFDFVVRTKEVDISDAKPAYEREQPWHVGNSTRLPSLTQEGELKAGTLNMSDQLYDTQIIATCFQCSTSGTYYVMAPTGTTTTTDYIRKFTIGERKTFFTYFEKGTNGGSTQKSLNLLGGLGDSIDITGSMNNYVTFNFSLCSIE